MVATINAIGSVTTTIGNELDVNREYGTTPTDNKWYSCYLDLHNMQNGDTGEIRIYGRIQAGGALQVHTLDVYQDAQIEPVWHMASMPNDNGLKITVKQTADIGRTFYYRI